MPRLKTYQYLIFPVIVLTAFLSVRLLGGQATRYAAKKIKPLTASQPTNKEPTRNDSLSKQIGDRALAQEIDRALDESDLRQARWGVFVKSLNDGRVLYSRNGSELFTPASNMKVYTTAVALDVLGSNYRWRTSVYAEKPPDSNAVVEGDLILYGRGAPDLISDRKGSAPSLADLAIQIYQRGVREVR